MDSDTIANIKTLAIDMIKQANSGHPGIVLSSSPILYALYKYHLNINPNDTEWFNRDRFIISAGHGSALLYSILYMCGYPLTLEDLKNFRSINSNTPGHPEYGVTKGVECTTGPLGQGVATAVGIALGEKILDARIKKDSNSKMQKIIDFKTYVLVSDGDLMEGISYEALSLAGTLALNNLIIIYDSNNTTLDGSTKFVFEEDIHLRFKAMGFNTYKVNDGNSISQLNIEINKAKKSKKPSFIEVKTHIGYGSLLQDTNKVHGTPLTDDDINQLKDNLKISKEPFYVNETLRRDLIGFIASRVGDKYNSSYDLYNKEIDNKLDTKYQDIKFYFKDNIKYDLSKYKWDIDKSDMRDINKLVLNKISREIMEIVGGSADLNSSTKAYLDYQDDITKNNFNSKNIWYGVREHAMGAITNGLALLKFIPFASTFLVFSDYLKPAIRMSALMNLKVIYIFTHDSIFVGKDGPTHQPVEQLSSLRALPNLTVYRPADLKEIVGCYQSILNNSNPSAIIIARDKEERLKNTSVLGTLKGGYVIKENENAKVTLISTGKDLVTSYKISLALDKLNIKSRVVSMPSVEIFLSQPKEYQDEVLNNKKRIVIEAASNTSLSRFTSFENVISIDSFGVSAEPKDVLKHMNFDLESILKKVIEIVNKN